MNLRQTKRESDENPSMIFLFVQILFSAGSWIAIFGELTGNPRDLLICSSIIGALVFLMVAIRAAMFKTGFWIAVASAFVLALPLLYTFIAIAVFGIGWTNC